LPGETMVQCGDIQGGEIKSGTLILKTNEEGK
jgi:hypothetical protein